MTGATRLAVALILNSTISTIIGCAGPVGEHKPLQEKPVGKTGDDSRSVGVGYQDVRPIFAQRCASCHPARNGPDWLDYSQAKHYAENGVLFRRVSAEKSMPPPGSPEAAAITSGERSVIAQWATSGGPEQPVVVVDRNTSLSTTSALEFPANMPVAAKSCLNCHGLNGPQAGAKLKIPRLAGQNAAYLHEQLRRFRWRDRIDPTNSMNEIAGEHDMTDENMKDVSEFFEGRPAFGETNPKDLGDFDQKVFGRGERIANDKCVQCHLNPTFGRGTSDTTVPALAGQSEIYLRNQLLYFRDNERKSPLMHEYARDLTNIDIEALSVYFSFVRSKD